jgi:hypothetical protein
VGNGLDRHAIVVSLKGCTQNRQLLADFMAADLSALDLLVVQIDGLHLGDDLVLVAAIGVTAKARSIRWRWWKGRPRMPQRFRPCWTTWSRAGSTRRCQDCSSPTARKR